MKLGQSQISWLVGIISTVIGAVIGGAGSFYGAQYLQGETDAKQNQALTTFQTEQLKRDNTQDITALKVKTKQLELDAGQNALISDIRSELVTLKQDMSSGFEGTNFKLDSNTALMKGLKEQVGDFETNVEELWLHSNGGGN